MSLNDPANDPQENKSAADDARSGLFHNFGVKWDALWETLQERHGKSSVAILIVGVGVIAFVVLFAFTELGDTPQSEPRQTEPQRTVQNTPPPVRDDKPSPASASVPASQPVAPATAVVDISATATITALGEEIQADLSISGFRRAYDKLARFPTDPTATDVEGCQIVFDVYVRYRVIHENKLGSDKLDRFLRYMQVETPDIVYALENDFLPLIQQCQAGGYLP